jgi:radical SAM protein with 4Fe4S-binding SPASM domain
MIKDQENFCILPWIHLYAEPNGDVYPCCTASPLPNIKPCVESLKEHTFEEIYHSDSWNKLRKDMLEGNRPSACTRCWKFDDAGGSSYRQYNNREFKKYYPLVEETKEDGSLDKFHFKFLNIRHSIECNFACLTCGPEWSTGWNKYTKGPGKHTKLDDNTKVPIWNQIKPHLDTADVIYFTGGEPLMMPDHYRIIDYLIQHGLTHLELRYNTNMSNLNLQKYNIVDKWKMFNKVVLGASIDAVGKRAELIRYGTKWDQLEANLLSVRGYDNIHLGIDSVISILNIDHIPEMQMYLEDKGIVDIRTIMSYNIAFGPSEFSITSLPDFIKQRLADQLHDHLEKYKGRLTHPHWGYKQIINFMFQENTWQHGLFKNQIDHRFKFVKDRLLEEVPIIKELYYYEGN